MSFPPVTVEYLPLAVLQHPKAVVAVPLAVLFPPQRNDERAPAPAIIIAGVALALCTQLESATPPHK